MYGFDGGGDLTAVGWWWQAGCGSVVSSLPAGSPGIPQARSVRTAVNSCGKLLLLRHKLSEFAAKVASSSGLAVLVLLKAEAAIEHSQLTDK